MVQMAEAPKLRDIDAKFRVKNIARELADSDAMMIRALEDLMLVLLKKKILGIDEIHPVVVEKIKHRRKLREEMRTLRERLEDKTKDDPNPKPALNSGLTGSPTGLNEKLT